MKPKEIFAAQRSSDWHSLRNSSVGSSEVSAVLGTSPFQTPFQLWEVKTKRKPAQKVNAAMQRGIDYEDEARELLEKVSGLKFVPRMFEHENYSFMRASLDGITDDLQINCEIKCPSTDGLRKYGQAGEAPPYYLSQMHYQMLCSGAKLTKFFTYYSKDEYYLVDVPANEEIQKDIIQKVSEFWKYIETDTPPPLTDKDYAQVTDESFESVVKQYQTTKMNFKDWETRLKDIEAVLKTKFKSLGHPAIKCGGLSILEYERKGTVNYSVIPELNNVDLEQYRKKSSKVIRIL